MSDEILQQIPEKCLACTKNTKQMLACPIIGEVPIQLLTNVKCYSSEVQNLHLDPRSTINCQERGVKKTPLTQVKGVYSGHIIKPSGHG